MSDSKKNRNIGASVRARLLNLAKQKGQAFDLLLTRYTIERLLHRLSISSHRDRFVLKGAMLMTTWFEDPHRSTRDVDFLGFGDPSPEPVLATFREICAIETGDDIEFDISTLRVELIREALAYGGLRLRAMAQLAGARITVFIDIGFGDAIEPGLEEVDPPVLLDMPKPRLCVHARATVVAEKFQAMVVLGLANTRMKDFYDVWILSRNYAFDEERLSPAIAATFERRATAIPTDAPDALTQKFASDMAKQRQWTAFVRDLAGNVPKLEVIVADLSNFLMPYARHATKRTSQPAE